MYCPICISEKRKGRNESFKDCYSLYWHLIRCHSDSDINPTREECLVKLQNLSDIIFLGIVR
jgi:hypothetical protein